MVDRVEEMRRLGRRLAAARKAAGLSQREVAEVLGIAQASYAHYEAGDRTISPTDLARLADYLCVSGDFLLGREVGVQDSLMDVWAQALGRDPHVPEAAREEVEELARAGRAREREKQRRAKLGR